MNCRMIDLGGNLTAENPEIAGIIHALANKMHRELEDALQGIKGMENRTPGRVE